jgi:hypothetical protein
MIPHRSVSRDTSENGVSFRVEACRRRLRLIRAGQKNPNETVEPVETPVTRDVEVGKIPTIQRVIGAGAERLDEVGIT